MCSGGGGGGHGLEDGDVSAKGGMNTSPQSL